MTPPKDDRMFSPWQEEGRRQALALEGQHFVLVVGDDPTAAAEVALGMGRVQAGHRRVVVADAVGLLSPIDDLVPFDAAKGIGDVFVQGVPVDEAAHAVDAEKKLLVLPSGPGVLDRASLFFSERWTFLTDEFRDQGALLIVVAPMRDSALDAILPLVDGVVLVGHAQPLPNVRALAYVRGPETAPLQRIVSTYDPDDDDSAVPDMPALKPAKRPGAIKRVTEAQQAAVAPRQRSRTWLVTTLALALAFEGGLWWWQHRPGAQTAAEEQAPAESAAADSTSGGDSTPPQAIVATLPDTAGRAQWAVVLEDASSATGANARLSQDVIRELPATTFSPLDDTTGRTFRLIAGAYTDRGTADSLLTALRAQKTLPATGGRVERLPYAILVQSGLSRDDASLFVSGLRAKGLPVYALVQDDGTARIYAGAFETSADAQLLVATLRANGEQAGITTRIGRLP